MEMKSFTSVQDFSTALTIGTRAASGNGAVSFSSPDNKGNLFYTPTFMKQCFHFRPMKMCQSMDDIKKGTSFEINLEVAGDNLSFRAAEQRLTNFIVTEMAKRATEFWPPHEAAKITSHDAAFVKFDGPFIRYGNNGYPDTIRLKILGTWHKYVADFKPRTARLKGADISTVDYCKWLPRDLALDPYKPADTRFYIWVGRDDAGNDKWSERVKREDGMGYRAVGPADCWPGNEVLPVFSADQIYFQKGFGFSAVARALYIKPKPKDAGSLPAGFTAYTAPAPLLPGVSLTSEQDEDEHF